MKIILVAGTRPNFVKIAPIMAAFARAKQTHPSLEYVLVHTGQHYDTRLSDSFFTDLHIPDPDYHLNVGSGTHTVQTATIMMRFEEVVQKEKPDWVLVVGDVNSTMACSLVAKKMGIRLAHVEGGLRSFDQEMPEEINRMVTDAITDMFFTTSDYANENLRKEGHADRKIHFVGNTMIDTLVAQLPHLRKPQEVSHVLDSGKQYVVLTLHRPSNVDNMDKLMQLLNEICLALGDKMIVFPAHPRTQKSLAEQAQLPANLILAPPIPYLEFIYLLKHSWLTVTDSGGIQEETTFLGIPCLTMRHNTERPETISMGTNVLIGDDMHLLRDQIHDLQKGTWKMGTIPPLWDGKAAERIVGILTSVSMVAVSLT